MPDEFPEADDLFAPERSPSGRPIYRHEPRFRDEIEPAFGDERSIYLITRHVERHIGPVQSVFHELRSDMVHIDIHMSLPTADRPFTTLVTSGMSDRPMLVPDGTEDFRFAELMLCLPPDWPLTNEALEEEKHYWPVRCLKLMARFPHEYETWLAWGHTVLLRDPPQPLAQSTTLCGLVLLDPKLAPPGFSRLVVHDDRIIHFYALVPLYAEEMQHKLESGMESLLAALNGHSVTELIDPERPNVCAED